MENQRKALLQSEDLVEHMENRGIRFEEMSKCHAVEFLKSHNNYFKLTSYRKNFPKYVEGSNFGKYIDLDFAYLVDMSKIDMYLRHFLMKVTLDIEHYIKINLLTSIELNSKEDGYKIVENYIASKEKDGRNRVIEEIRRNSGNPYCGELLEKHGIDSETESIDNFPVWVFIEVIAFGTLRDFYGFYYKTYKDSDGIKDKSNAAYLLKSVNQLRNAVAHNNCIINNLYPIRPNSVREIKTDNRVSNFLTHLGINTKMKNTKMKNPRINQIITTLYLFDKVVTSDNVKKNRYRELNALVIRMKRNASYYMKNPTIVTAFKFFEMISEKLCSSY